MQGAPFAVETDAIPVKNAAGGIRVLLDFSDDQTTLNGMETPRRHQHRVALADWDAMYQVSERHRRTAQGVFETSSCDAPAQAGNQMGVLRHIHDVPHFGFRFSAELGGDGWGRMNLERETLVDIEQLDEQWKPFRAGTIGTQESRAERFDELTERPAFLVAVGDDRLGVIAVANLPRFSDKPIGRQPFTEPGKGSTTPNAFHQ